MGTSEGSNAERFPDRGSKPASKPEIEPSTHSTAASAWAAPDIMFGMKSLGGGCKGPPLHIVEKQRTDGDFGFPTHGGVKKAVQDRAILVNVDSKITLRGLRDEVNPVSKGRVQAPYLHPSLAPKGSSITPENTFVGTPNLLATPTLGQTCVVSPPTHTSPLAQPLLLRSTGVIDLLS